MPDTRQRSPSSNGHSTRPTTGWNVVGPAAPNRPRRNAPRGRTPDKQGGSSVQVVALIHFYLPHHRAGSETMLHAMFRALANAGHEAHVVVTSQPEGDDDYSVEGIEVHRAGAGKRTVPRLVASLQPDVLLTH